MGEVYGYEALTLAAQAVLGGLLGFVFTVGTVLLGLAALIGAVRQSTGSGD